ncbi:major facilitator superfamily domain-containing protein [Apodospora peruviana]|uniref:Major facilitator superfamily domain-containing protein n=1 Tax=Apodospora peruviana TaxID=516989 RepID=A0AAE0I4G1_9PEZI|nr:major facilitator superfamily domain-containing protein [Apodospora peruviana]
MLTINPPSSAAAADPEPSPPPRSPHRINTQSSGKHSIERRSRIPTGGAPLQALPTQELTVSPVPSISSSQGIPLSRCAAASNHPGPGRRQQQPQEGLSEKTGNNEARFSAAPPPPPHGSRADGKIEMREQDAWSELGYSFPQWKKWMILTIVFLVQMSMNFNTTLYSDGLGGISREFGVSMQAARAGAAIFLITYAFGCELWAPWSEEFGRKPVLQLSLGLVNLWCLPVALAPNFGSVLVGRALGGLSSAGGSVTLGMIADMFEPDEQQYAVAYIVFSSVAGSILGPIIGGFCQEYLHWRWTIWIQLIFGAFVQLLHLVLVPETRSTILLDRIARKRRKAGENVYGPNELGPFWERFTFRELMRTWGRPFRMFATEPIVLTLSLLSGFSDALIFMQVQSFALVYRQWGFSKVQLGLSFIPIGIGYVIAWLSYIPAFRRNQRQRERQPENDHVQYESRLWWLLYTAPCLPIGLIIFAWTSGGPPVHWIGTMAGSATIGIANYSIYMATIDYMIAAYGPYSASATGGNGWARDFLAGVLTVPATPFYENIGETQHLQLANTIVFCISVVLVCFVYVIYHFGPALRKRSPFAESLASTATSDPARHAHLAARLSTAEVEQLEHPGFAGGPARQPNPNIVVTEASADSHATARRRGHEARVVDRHDVDGYGYGAGEEASRMTGLSGDTEVDETERR